jgi:T5SS/PEP-CTERM-associated repeat protein/autotransporter-associated beta strand protein
VTAVPPVSGQYIWNNSAGGNWSAGSNWQGGTPPASGSTTTLTFGTAATQSATYTATNDIGASGTAFDLNALTVNNSAGTVTLAGNPLNFTGTNPTVTVAGTGSMALSQAATLAATTTVAGTGTGGFTFGGALNGGSNNLVKTSAGSLALAGGGTLNSLQLAAGMTTVIGGTLALTQPTTQPNYTAFGLQMGLASGQTTAFNQTGGTVNVTEDVSLGHAAGSTGTATVTGSGTVFDTTIGGQSGTIFVGRNGTGGLNITSGGVVNTVQVYAGSNSGSIGSVTVDGAGSVLNFRTNGFSELFVGASGSGTLTVSNGGRVNSTGPALTANSAGSSGTMTVTGAGSTLTAGILSVGLAGTGTLNVQNGGQVTVTGNVFTAYYPGSQGTTNVTDPGSSLTVSQRLTLGGAGTTLGGTGTLNVGSGGTVTVGAGGQSFTGGQLYAGGTINLNAGGVLSLSNLQDGTPTSTGAVHLASGTKLTITSGGTIFSGVMSGAGGLTMAGSNVQTLAGDNTYSGPTTVTSGTLRLIGNGSIAGSGRITVGTAPSSSAVLDVSGVTGGANFGNGGFALASGQTLAGHGTVVGPVTIAGGSAVAPGASVGTLSVADMTWQGGGRYDFEFAGATGDLLNGSGQLALAALNSSSRFTVNIQSFDASLTTPQTYTIATFAGGITGFDPTPGNPQFAFSGLLVPGSASLALQSNSLQLTFTPVAEPSRLLLLCIVVAVGAACPKHRQERPRRVPGIRRERRTDVTTLARRTGPSYNGAVARHTGTVP